MTDEIQTLGGFEVRLDGRTRDELKNRPTCSAVLIYVATERKVTRDPVLAVLWSDRSEARARHALSQTLYQLRQCLGRDCLPGSGRELRLADGIRVDTAALSQAVLERRFTEAVELYGGRFLEGWHFRSAAAFQHWVDRQAERFASLHRTACRGGIASRIAASDRLGARALAERWAELEPDGAEAHRELIRLLVEDGEHEAAVERFAAFERRLAEVDAVPGPEILEAVAPARTRRKFLAPDAIQPTAPLPRIVVLPFAHTGPPRYADLTYALGDETTVRLSRHPGLAVISRSSALTFAGKARSLIEIGSELQVDHVLEGAVRWHSDGSPAPAVVSPQLVRVGDGRQLWAAQLDTDSRSIATLHVRLADRTISTLGLTPLGRDSGAAATETGDPAAWELYTRGLQHWHQRSSAGLGAAIELFLQAIELQPSYARAYGGLALAYALMPSFLGETPGAWIPRAKRAALRALQLDPDSVEGHLARGIIAWIHDLDTALAGRHWHRTLELEPSNAQAMIWLAYRSTVLGHTEEARRQMTAALTHDPLTVSTNFDAAMVLWCLRDRVGAVTHFRRVLQIDPVFAPAAFMLGVHHLTSGEIDDARREWSRIRMFGPTWRTVLDSLDDPPRAVTAIDRIVEISPLPVLWYAIALLYLLFGEPDRALFWIDVHLRNVRGEPVAYPTGGPGLFFAAIDPTFESLRPAPQYQNLLHVLGLDTGPDRPRIRR